MTTKYMLQNDRNESDLAIICDTGRISHQKCSMKKGALKNFTKFTGKHLCQSLFLNKIAGLRLLVFVCVMLIGLYILWNFCIFSLLFLLIFTLFLSLLIFLGRSLVYLYYYKYDAVNLNLF